MPLEIEPHERRRRVAELLYAEEGVWPTKRDIRNWIIAEARNKEKEYNPLLTYFYGVFERLSPLEASDSPHNLLDDLVYPKPVTVLTVESLQEWDFLSALLGIQSFVDSRPERILPPPISARADRFAHFLFDLVESGEDEVRVSKVIRAMGSITLLDPLFVHHLGFYRGESGQQVFDILKDVFAQALGPLSEIMGLFESEFPQLVTKLQVVDDALRDTSTLLNLQGQNNWLGTKYDFPGEVDNFLPTLLYLAKKNLAYQEPGYEVSRDFLFAVISRRIPLSLSNITIICRHISEQVPEILYPFIVQLLTHNIISPPDEFYAALNISKRDVITSFTEIAARDKPFSFQAEHFDFFTGGFNYFHNRQLLAAMASLRHSRKKHGGNGRVIVQPWMASEENQRGLAADTLRLWACLSQLEGLTGKDLSVTIHGQNVQGTPSQITRTKFTHDIPNWLRSKGAPDGITLGRISGLEKINDRYQLTHLPHTLLVNAPPVSQRTGFLTLLDGQVRDAFRILRHPPAIIFLPCPDYRGEILRPLIEAAADGDNTAYHKALAMVKKSTLDGILNEV